MSTFAQTENSLTLTITPPIFQLTQAPGTDWRSGLRVVNSNHYDIVVTARVQDFHPDGETGNPIFEEKPMASPEDTRNMSGWIAIEGGPITIKRDTTQEIPFTIHVPINADPGGHYGAILISTSAGDVGGGSGAGVSSAISSLLFLRVPGEVIEEGEIRDFYAEKSLVQTPESSFVLRFENKGNVHLVPQGEIVISNMWDKVRGKIAINETNTFGNVLPRSTRKFEFKWTGESNPFEVGRYKAEAILAYGADGRKTVFRTTYFWVVPFKPVAGILGGLTLFMWFLMWSVRRYIRKALAMEGVQMETYNKEHATKNTNNKETPAITFAVLKRPLVQTSIDLRKASMSSPATQNKNTKTTLAPESTRISWAKWFAFYRPYIVFFAVLIIGFSLIGWYFVEVFQSERTYHVEQIRSK